MIFFKTHNFWSLYYVMFRELFYQKLKELINLLYLMLVWLKLNISEFKEMQNSPYPFGQKEHVFDFKVKVNF